MLYTLRSAAKNIRRYAGRYLLFGVLIFAALAVGTASLMIGRALDGALESLMNKYGGTILVYRGSAYLTPEEYAPIEAFAEVESVNNTRFYFEVFQAAISIDGQRIRTAMLMEDMRARKVYTNYHRDKLNFVYNTKSTDHPNMGVIGIDFDLDPLVNHGNSETYLYEGRYPENDRECAVNQTYLDWVGFTEVKPGSTLTLTLGDTVREYTIVGLEGGIYQDTTRVYQAETNSFTVTQVKPWQCPILLTYEAAEGLRLDGTLEDYYLGEQMRVGVSMKPVAGSDGEVKYSQSGIALSNQSLHNTQIKLKSYTLYDSFMASMAQLSAETGRGYEARMAYAGADQLLEAYRSAGRIADIALAAVIAIAAVIVLIMSALSMHERKYEIGVLLSVGMQKWRIAAMFALENLIFTLAVALLAYAVGSAAAPDAAERFFAGVVDLVRANVALPTAAWLLGLAVGLSCVASLISSLSILRYKPMAILRSRT